MFLLNTKKRKVCGLFYSFILMCMGCKNFIHNHEHDYRLQKEEKKLVIPCKIQYQYKGDLMELPIIKDNQMSVTQKNGNEFELIKPNKIMQYENGTIYTMTNDRNLSLMVKQSKKDLISSLELFLKKNNITISNITDQTIETDWVFNKNKKSNFIGELSQFPIKSASETRFCFSISFDNKNQVSKIMLKNKLRKKMDIKTSLSWNKESNQLNRYVMNQFLLFLYDLEQNKKLDLAESFDVMSQTLVVTVNDNPALRINNVTFNHAWKLVDEAIKKAKLNTINKNNSIGVFYILLNSMSRLVDLENNKKNTDTIEENIKSPPTNTKTYWIRLVDSNGFVEITLEENNDTYAPKELSNKVLKILQDNLGHK